MGFVLLACGGTESGSTSGIPATGGGTGTGGSGGCAPGAETCPCYGNGTCNAGLACASNLCVKWSGTGGTNGAGGTGAGGVPVGGSGGAQQCYPEGSTCSGNPAACCLGLMCVVDARSPVNGTCARLCVSGIDCTTGCCEPLTTGTASVCAPALYCSPTCRSTGSSCLDNPGACCPNTTCAYTSLLASTPSCAAFCAFNSDCASGCCAPLGSGASVCADPSYCASNCLPAGTRPCGLGTDCCPGSYCISDAINQICLPLCTSNTQCSTGCCAAPNGNGVYVCTDPAYCP